MVLKQESAIDRGLSKEEEFGLGRLNMDEPITWARSIRFQEESGKRLNSLEKRKNEEKLINFSQLLEYDLFSFLIVFCAYFLTCNGLPQPFIVILKSFIY